jgi:hypothetical protein
MADYIDGLLSTAKRKLGKSQILGLLADAFNAPADSYTGKNMGGVLVDDSMRYVESNKPLERALNLAGNVTSGGIIASPETAHGLLGMSVNDVQFNKFKNGLVSLRKGEKLEPIDSVASLSNQQMKDTRAAGGVISDNNVMLKPHDGGHVLDERTIDGTPIKQVANTFRRAFGDTAVVDMSLSNGVPNRYVLRSPNGDLGIYKIENGRPVFVTTYEKDSLKKK